MKLLISLTFKLSFYQQSKVKVTEKAGNKTELLNWHYQPPCIDHMVTNLNFDFFLQ